ncbi:MAG: 3-isopropylmalate dehydrogenase [Eubacteriales bacterium]|nr:3-isopropylmalate dehydrogenase [Eubacteriales bacterium]
MEKKPLQWHPGFQSALQVELMEDREHLRFEKEYNLTRKPLEIDVLIKKDDDYQVGKSIGRIFRRHNIIEYKSPEDYVSLNVLYKVLGYACLYQSDTERVGEIHPDDITTSIMCSHYPRKLLSYLHRRYGTEVRSMYPGVYYLTNLLFPVQIVILPQLPGEDYVWMSRLRCDLNAEEDVKLLTAAYSSREHDPLYQSVMDVIVRANEEEFKEEHGMCDALMEILEELADKRAEKKAVELAEKKAEELAEKKFADKLKATEQAVLCLKLIGQVRKKCRKDMNVADITECLEESAEVIQAICDTLKQNPEADDQRIYEILEAENRCCS